LLTQAKLQSRALGVVPKLFSTTSLRDVQEAELHITALLKAVTWHIAD
jgi:hypothetical protein